jgi:hypothetical protein
MFTYIQSVWTTHLGSLNAWSQLVEAAVSAVGLLLVRELESNMNFRILLERSPYVYFLVGVFLAAAF